MNRKVLWTLQILLAALFLFAGGMKLLTPMPPFMKFIGVCEVLGALGLVLPGLFKVRLLLTPLAALGLVVIMIGAVAMTLSPIPLAVGLAAAYVAACHILPAWRASSATTISPSR